MNKKTLKFLGIFLLLALCCATVFSACKNNNDSTKGKVDEIVERGTLLVGTTGDYRPLTFRESRRVDAERPGGFATGGEQQNPEDEG